MKNLYIIVLMLFSFLGCVSKGEYETLLTENNKLRVELGGLKNDTEGKIASARYEALLTENGELKIELNELKNGAGSIIALVENAYEEENFLVARENIALLKEKYPESEKNKDFAKLLIDIKKQEQAKEKIRLENLDNMGIWEIRYYIDKFGDYTSSGYISTHERIKGTFSDSRTTNSELGARVLITDSSNIDIKLYEYDRNAENEGSSSYPEKYDIYIKDDNDKFYYFAAENTSDRVSFNKKDSSMVHNLLVRNTSLKFTLELEGYGNTISSYTFIIPNMHWYGNAYLELAE